MKSVTKFQDNWVTWNFTKDEIVELNGRLFQCLCTNHYSAMDVMTKQDNWLYLGQKWIPNMPYHTGDKIYNLAYFSIDTATYVCIKAHCGSVKPPHQDHDNWYMVQNKYLDDIETSFVDVLLNAHGKINLYENKIQNPQLIQLYDNLFTTRLNKIYPRILCSEVDWLKEIEYYNDVIVGGYFDDDDDWKEQARETLELVSNKLVFHTDSDHTYIFKEHIRFMVGNTNYAYVPQGLRDVEDRMGTQELDLNKGYAMIIHDFDLQ